MLSLQRVVTCLAVVTAALLVSGACRVSAQEAVFTTESHGLTVTLTLDKEVYRAGDPICFTLNVSNGRENWKSSASDIVYDIEGLGSVGDPLKAEIPSLLYGESYTVSGTLGAKQSLYDKALESQKLMDAEAAQNGSTEGNGADTSVSASAESDTASDLTVADTSESFVADAASGTDEAFAGTNRVITIAAVAVGAVLLVLALILMFKKKKGTKALALILVFVLAVSAVPASAGNTETVKIWPYVYVQYGGERLLIRMMMEFSMNLQKIKVDSSLQDKAKTVTCHDPSIYKDKDGTYYVLGTHVTGAKSTDLSNWTSIDQTMRSAFSEETKAQMRAWNKDSSVSHWYDYMWAPDIVYNPVLGKYCYYISANGDAWKSNIVMLTADSVTGPFTYAGSVVYGGFVQNDMAETDVGQVLGTDTLPDRYILHGIKNGKWGDKWPNCIDPCVFYDEEGRLWMSYGSWSGGIFLLKLDETTGLRDYSVSYETNDHSDAYFGKKIAGGCYVSGEGSYIQHIGDYYYLFVSYGNLEADGGYNIRIFRADEPDGDYRDPLGNSPLFDKYVFNYNLSIGERLFGGYMWRTFSTGDAAQGHNSAFIDDDGKAYMVYHTRTTNGTEAHHVKVVQLFTTKDGWLVAAPYRMGGETLEPEGHSTSELAGDYEIIIHDLRIDYAGRVSRKPVPATLNADGTITGSLSGTWTKEEGTPYITLVIDGVTYSGVELVQNVEDTKIQTNVFTALGDNQITIWGSKVFEY